MRTYVPLKGGPRPPDFRPQGIPTRVPKYRWRSWVNMMADTRRITRDTIVYQQKSAAYVYPNRCA